MLLFIQRVRPGYCVEGLVQSVHRDHMKVCWRGSIQPVTQFNCKSVTQVRIVACLLAVDGAGVAVRDRRPLRINDLEDLNIDVWLGCDATRLNRC